MPNARYHRLSLAQFAPSEGQYDSMAISVQLASECHCQAGIILSYDIPIGSSGALLSSRLSILTNMAKYPPGEHECYFYFALHLNPQTSAHSPERLRAVNPNSLSFITQTDSKRLEITSSFEAMTGFILAQSYSALAALCV